MVDIFGHAGYLDEAEDLLECSPQGFNVVGWTSLLHSCKLYVNVATAKRCFNNVVLLDPKASSAYVLMSSVYSHAGMLRCGEELEAVRRKEIGWKKFAHSFIEVDSKVHDFTIGDKFHPQSVDIYAKLDALNAQLKKEGYAPRVDLVVGPMSKQKKEEALCGHSEKLATAYGLISLSHGTTIRVSKNPRMCGDCHNTSKLISKIEKREIFVNDSYQMHRFVPVMIIVIIQSKMISYRLSYRFSHDRIKEFSSQQCSDRFYPLYGLCGCACVLITLPFG
ncbi:hypothetical protein L7F22_032876 [Adiantum nelumboides]|nr:hypothetical protein [Adiantum nelumboides]